MNSSPALRLSGRRTRTPVSLARILLRPSALKVKHGATKQGWDERVGGGGGGGRGVGGGGDNRGASELDGPKPG